LRISPSATLAQAFAALGKTEDVPVDVVLTQVLLVSGYDVAAASVASA
jgi:hypothetical protein